MGSLVDVCAGCAVLILLVWMLSRLVDGMNALTQSTSRQSSQGGAQTTINSEIEQSGN